MLFPTVSELRGEEGTQLPCAACIHVHLGDQVIQDDRESLLGEFPALLKAFTPVAFPFLLPALPLLRTSLGLLGHNEEQMFKQGPYFPSFSVPTPFYLSPSPPRPVLPSLLPSHTASLCQVYLRQVHETSVVWPTGHVSCPRQSP